MRSAVAPTLTLLALVLGIAVLVVWIVMSRQVATPAPSPTSTATATVTVSPSPTATPTSSPTPTPTPTAPTRYVSVALGYAIDTLPPWRRSTCSSVSFTQQGIFHASDAFVPVSTRDETGTDTGVVYPTVRVAVEDNPQNLTPRQWAEQGKTVGSTAGERVEDVTFAGRPAARKTLPGTQLAIYFVTNGPRMFVVIPSPGATAPDAVTEQAMVAMVGSFRFASEAEIAAARALPTPPVLQPRTPEELADALAQAIPLRNAAALGDYLAACVTVGVEQGGASFMSKEKYLADLNAAFTTALLSVSVRPRPFEGDRASGALSIGSSWRTSQGTVERKLLLRRGANERWEWAGTLDTR